MSTDDIEAPDLPPPEAREDFLCPLEFEARLAAGVRAGDISNGWLICGGAGAGKATLAFRLARAILEPGAMSGKGLHVPHEAKVFSLVAASAHPDLFIARPQLNEKTGRMSAEISVETVRKLTHFMNRTASFGGWRVAIIDTADQLNRSAANALLKVLEEPPSKSVLFLLSATPGRLLATIRSRCRKIILPSVPTAEISSFLESETDLDAEERMRIAEASEGRPGRALQFAASDGAKAIEFVDRFLDVDRRLTDAEIQALTGRNATAVWSTFRPLLQQRLAAMVRKAAYASASDNLLRAHEEISELFVRGEAVNVDKAQMLSAAARRLRDALSASGHNA